MNYSKIIMGVGIGVSVISAAISIGVSAKKQKKLEKAIDEISENITVDTDNSLVKDIVDRAVNNSVGPIIRSSANRAVADIESEIRQQVKNAVDEVYFDIKPAVKAELDKKVGEISISKIRKEVLDAAKERAAEKFDEDLKTVIEQYNKNLENINTIYSNIAKTLQAANDKKGTTLTIG